MKISQGWLAEFVALNPTVHTPQVLQDRLTSVGLEVEEVVDMAATLSGFVVGRVITKEKHPKADKLSVCTVDVGDGTLRTIVCGAPNVDAGQTVPVALVGARVPGADFVIEERPLRGVTSQGMICSQAELGMGTESDGIWVLNTDAPSGTPLAAALGVDDVVYDVAITPNRADCLSHVGMARDVAASFGVAGSAPSAEASLDLLKSATATPSDIQVTVADAALCPHYMAWTVHNVQPVASPEWMQRRLRAIGLRPRNIIVDVTNYVNMEMGQPLHAFDAAKIGGAHIIVRTATSEELEFTTLDGKKRTITPSMLMICDANQPLAVAGVMGGENSEVDESTRSVVLESAYFAPSSVRRTAKSLGISSDASYRFERGVDPNMVRTAAARAVELLVQLAGGSSGACVEVGGPPPAREAIRYSPERIQRLLGVELSDEIIAAHLRSVGCVVSDNSAVPPSWRADITSEADLAEEVMRLHGIDNIPPSDRAWLPLVGGRLPESVRAGGRNGLKIREIIRTMLVARGYYDCVTNVLTGPDTPGNTGITLKNALGRDFSVMRGSSIPSLLEVASRNLRHGQQTVRLMEIGSRFEQDQTAEFGIRQREGLTLVVTGQTDPHWGDKPRSLDIYDLVGELHVLYPRLESIPLGTPDGVFTENRVELRIDGAIVGYAGEVDPAVTARYEIDRIVSAAVINIRAVPLARRTYQRVGQFPSVRRDLSFMLAADVPAGRVIDVVRTASPLILRDVGVFDVYKDTSLADGQKSIGIGLTFRSDDRTLVDEEVDSAIDKIISSVKDVLQATIRGAN